MTVEAVVFDLDYTLAVPRRTRNAILQDAARAVGVDGLSREEYLAVHTDHLTRESREPIFASLLDDADADPATAATVYREELAAALEPVPDAERLVRDLKRDYRVGLLTNSPRVAGRDKLAALGWTDLFDATVVTGDLPVGKPHRRAFEAVLDDLDVVPENAVYVGDSVEADVEGATAAGIHAVQIVGADDDPHPRAVAHLQRGELAARLPEVLRRIGAS